MAELLTCHPVRERVLAALSGNLPAPLVIDEPLFWQITNDDGVSLHASVSATDDNIEWGILLRDETGAHNVLHASMVLEDSYADLYVVSGMTNEFNFTQRVTETRGHERLDSALGEFVSLISGRDHD